MSRYTGSTYRKSRRLNFSTLETGKELVKKPYAPGQGGQTRRKKLSKYGIQLEEKLKAYYRQNYNQFRKKQKFRFMYGLNEKQFKHTFEKAGKKHGVHGVEFLKLLESRLDNLVYRIGFSTTRKGARQLVNHGHVTVNGKKVDIPSYTCKVGDIIGLKENAKELTIVKSSLEQVKKRVEFVTYDEAKSEGTFVRMPERSELNADINESLIVEFYNRA